MTQSKLKVRLYYAMKSNFPSLRFNYNLESFLSYQPISFLCYFPVSQKFQLSFWHCPLIYLVIMSCIIPQDLIKHHWFKRYSKEGRGKIDNRKIHNKVAHLTSSGDSNCGQYWSAICTIFFLHTSSTGVMPSLSWLEALIMHRCSNIWSSRCYSKTHISLPLSHSLLD